MKRNFNEWLNTFIPSIATYEYYIDFEKVYENVDNIKVELNILNSLIGSKNIEKDFEELITKYPEVIKCIPILLAVRDSEIIANDKKGSMLYKFLKGKNTIDEYKYFMRETGLFELISARIINNLVDYVLGVEVGLNSNGRKNRGGHLMENLVEEYLIQSGVEYYKEMKTSTITQKWNIDLTSITNQDKSIKKFDFVVKTNHGFYAIETNFYSSSGSKLNETARSYKSLANDSKNIKGFTFIWVTDGMGWISARNNLEETFGVLEHIYNLKELEDGLFHKIFK